MQNPIQKFRQPSKIVFENSGILSEKLKTLTTSIIFVEILHTFSTYQCLQKGVQDLFYFVYIKLYGSVARQSFQFFRKITWFLGNNRALSKFKQRILHYLKVH